jgi:hypothetical protein
MSVARSRASSANAAKLNAKKTKEKNERLNAEIRQLKVELKKAQNQVPAIPANELQEAVIGELTKHTKHVSDRKFLKEQIMSVFFELGGAHGMYLWAMENSANQKEYYKMFAGMLKAESEAAGTGNGGVVVNFTMGNSGEAAIDISPKKPGSKEKAMSFAQPDQKATINITPVDDIDDLCK